MKHLCSICERKISRGWYCYNCYQTYKEDIENKEKWAMFLQNCEKRRRREPIVPVIYLGDKYDISSDGVLVLKDGW